MESLIERVRARAFFLATRAEAGKDDFDPRTVMLLRDAADEIERLEHEVQSLSGYPPHIMSACAFCQRTGNK